MTILFSLLLPLLLIQQPVNHLQPDSVQSQAQAILQQGLRAESEGNPVEALSRWERGRLLLQKPSLEIGRQYIRLATEEGADSLYRRATGMYLWGISAERVEPNRAALGEEIAFLEPLATDSELRSWRANLERGDPLIFRQLTGFWKKMDPTLSTEHNERLVEHWERIAYARKNFDRGQRTAFGTDERGEVYLRYGEPDLVKNGVLQYHSSLAKSIIVDIIQTGLRDPNAYRRLDSPIKNYPNSFAREAQNHHLSPEYEIWVYRVLNPDSEDHTIFTFGSNAETGNFERVTSVEDFIPNEAFSMGARQIISVSGIRGHETINQFSALKNIRVGIVLQMMYYDQLSTVDAFFGNMYEDIASRVNDRSSISPSLGEEMKTRSQMELTERRLRSPRDRSESAEAMRDIPVDAYSYRMLGEDGRPYLAVFIQSSPQESYLVDYLYNYDSTPVSELEQLSSSQREEARRQRANYRLVHHARSFGPSWAQVDESTKEAEISVRSGETSGSYHLVPNTVEGARLLAGAELHNSDRGSEFQGTAPSFPREIRGSGTVQLDQPPPLSDDPAALEMGDLILGYGLDESAEAASSPGGRFPFTVAHDGRIPAGEPLVLHVQAYHLRQNAEDRTDFSLTYEVLKPNTSLRWLRGDYSTSLEVTLNEQTLTPRYRQNLQIETRELEPGDYLLRLAVTDKRSGQTEEREIEFRVTGG